MFLAASGSQGGTVAGVVVIVIISTGLYFVPLIVAAIRGVSNTGSVAVINLFLGWTVIGWIVALAMACKSVYQVSITDQRSPKP